MKFRLSEQRLRQQVRYFDYYQVIASGVAIVFAIGTLLALATQLGRLVGLLYPIVAVELLLCCFEIYCGYHTLKQPQRGLKLSRISLLSQWVATVLSFLSACMQRRLLIQVTILGQRQRWFRRL